MENFTKLLRERLFLAFYVWLDTNKEAIGKKWYNQLHAEGKKIENDANNLAELIAAGMWMFAMVTNLGVSAGIGPNSIMIESVATGIDVQSTRRLLSLASSALATQNLPKELLEKPIPIISATKFSLLEWGRKKGITSVETIQSYT